MPLRRKKAPYQPKGKSTQQELQKQRIDTSGNQGFSRGPPVGNVRSQDCGGLFTIGEALDNPLRCRRKCDPIFWEEKVMQPLLDEIYTPEYRVKPPDALSLQPCIDESSLESIYYHQVQIARSHREAAKIVMNTGPHDFARQWELMTRDKRTKSIAVAIEISMSSTQLGTCRFLCPDISLKLAEGDKFLDLLKHITYSGVKFPNSDNYLPLRCAEFERCYRIRGEESSDTGLPPTRAIRAAEASIRNIRNQAIADFIICLVQPDVSLSAPYAIGNKLSDPTEQESTQWLMINPSYIAGAVVQKPRKQGVKNFPHNFARHEPVRENVIFRELGTSPVHGILLPTMNEKYTHPQKICRACRRYASETEDQDCQAIDWEHHKIICGKRFTELGLPFAGEQSQKFPDSARPPSFWLQWQLYLAQAPGFLSNKDSESKSDGILYDFFLSEPNSTSSGPRSYEIPRNEVNEYIELLFQRALKTLDEEDIRSFVTELAAYSEAIKEVKRVFVDQIAKDWELEIEKVRKWAEEGWRISKSGELRNRRGSTVV
ncbi:hypothetical protein JCM3765_005186 [Sporobolomyces pararoseus]